MMRLIGFMILIAGVFADNLEKDISFRYGFLGQWQSNPDSTVEFGDNSIVHTDDYIRINIGYVNNSYFYLIYLDSEGSYSLFLPEVSRNENSQDTLYTTVLRGGLTDPPGNETFYLINSLSPCTDLTKLVNRYENAPPKGRAKLSRKIQAQLNALDPNAKVELVSITSRLDKPLVGGVAFRGDDDEQLKDMSLTHECKGKGGIAFQKIVLQHK